MDLSQAMHILGVSARDDARTIKSKYHHLMSLHHPDSHQSDEPEHLIRAQLINEAYRLLRSETAGESAAEEDSAENPLWQMTPCRELYAPRDIYFSYDIYGDSYETLAARGKYLWDPDAEEFSHYIRSINQLCTHLMSQIAEAHFLSEKNIPEEKRFPHHKALFHALAGHYMDPCACLPKLMPPQRIDPEGRSIFHFRAHLGASGSDAHYQALSLLQRGELLLPQAIEDHRILVCTRSGMPLGHLSLEKDSFYLCLIPLLQAKKAQLKLTVRNIVPLRGAALDLRAHIDLYIRLEIPSMVKDYSQECRQIRRLLDDWHQALLVDPDP